MDDKKEKVTALTKQVEGMSLEGMAGHLMKSGYFKDISDPSKAVIKIMAGREVGLGPIASMMGLHVIEGKVTYSATMVGALIKKAGYSWTVQWTDDEGGKCILNFRDKTGANLGTSAFSMKDAKAAGLDNKHNWKTYPKAMMFARALSQGGRWFCPEVFAGGPCYTVEELAPNARVTEDGEVVDAVSVQTIAVDPLVEKRDKMVAAFAGQGVTLDALEAFCGCPVAELTIENVDKLKDIFKELRAGKRDATLAEVGKAAPAAVAAVSKESDDIPESVEQTDGELYATLQKVRAKDSRAFDRVLVALLGCKWEKFDARSRDDFMTMLRSDYVQGMLKGAGVDG